ncbi:MAG: hypothetical protein FJ248_08655 [Nitrospira sp.]|nr:hypothetical protein [Nitrospira sp.]
MGAWLQECPQCRFVNGNLEEAVPNAQAVLASIQYEQIVADTVMPELARKFARHALLNADDKEKAGLALLRSAWVCDDEGAVDGAITYRSQAADFLLSLQPFDDTEERATLGTALIDVLRRALRFSEAKALSATLLLLRSVSSNEIIGKVLQHQSRLCDSKNTDCHTVEDAIKAG